MKRILVLLGVCLLGFSNVGFSQEITKQQVEKLKKSVEEIVGSSYTAGFRYKSKDICDFLVRGLEENRYQWEIGNEEFDKFMLDIVEKSCITGVLDATLYEQPKHYQALIDTVDKSIESLLKFKEKGGE